MRRFTALLAGVLLFCLACRPAETLAQEQLHPFIPQQDIKSETCLTCHPTKKEGKFVHTAVTMGCESCHTASSENEKTTITLNAQDGTLCAMCHEAKKDPVVHLPYKDGQCLVCHNPHASDFPDHIRAEVNTLCLSCHGMDRPDIKVNTAAKTVTLLGDETIPLDEYQQAPKIGLDPTGRFGHPWMSHPVAETPDPLHKGEKMSCLSCHEPHATAQAKLIRAAAQKGTDICEACHQAVQEKKEELWREKHPLEQPHQGKQQAPAGQNKPDGKQP
jgi:predicted CXXCH cytochrome family protein